MANVWWSSDYHFSHFNIIKYCHRPFTTVEEMNDTIIKNHNMRVKPEDTVFFLGDFVFRNSPGGKKGEGEIYRAEYFIKQLNGRFVFICGNHDRNNSLKTPIEKVYIKFGGHRICMVHSPIHADPNKELNLVGHVHEKWVVKRLNEKSILFNVGVDVHNFKPISYEEINKLLHQFIRHEKKEIKH